MPDNGRNIYIKEGVWLGSGVIVLGPAAIGENAVVAAGSSVIGDVPPNTIMAGHPAKPVKKIDGHRSGLNDRFSLSLCASYRRCMSF